MMMNLRGLVMDDPDHTEYLRTLQFDQGPHSGPEKKEVV